MNLTNMAKIIVSAGILLFLPALVALVDWVVGLAGIPRFLPMTAAEMTSYLGTVGAIFWAMYAFFKQMSFQEDRAEKEDKTETVKNFISFKQQSAQMDRDTINKIRNKNRAEK